MCWKCTTNKTYQSSHHHVVLRRLTVYLLDGPFLDLKAVWWYFVTSTISGTMRSESHKGRAFFILSCFWAFGDLCCLWSFFSLFATDGTESSKMLWMVVWVLELQTSESLCFDLQFFCGFCGKLGNLVSLVSRVSLVSSLALWWLWLCGSVGSSAPVIAV